MPDDGREFTHNVLGARILLYKNSEELTQGDFDRFFRSYQQYTSGDMKIEDEGKKLRAAFDAKWIESLTFPDGPIQSAGEVSAIHPQRRVRWAAACIDGVILAAREIPKELSSKPPTTPNESD